MQFTLGITGDLLTNEGNPCFGLQPLETLYKEKKILVEWMDPSIQILSEKETTKYECSLTTRTRTRTIRTTTKNEIWWQKLHDSYKPKVVFKLT